MNRNLGRRLFLSLALVTTTACTATSSAQTGRTQADWPVDSKLHTTLSAGFRSVDHAFVDDHAAYGLEVDYYRPTQSFGYEAGVTFAFDDALLPGEERESAFYEGYLGIRKTFGHADAGFHPYVGAGGTYINEEVNHVPAPTSPPDARVTGAGGYARVGGYWRVANISFEADTEINFGVDVRGVVSEDIDFVQASVFISIGR